MGKRVSKIVENIRCPRCKGEGRVHDKAACVFSIGLTYLLECIKKDYMDTCPECMGKGIIKKVTTEIIEEDIE